MRALAAVLLLALSGSALADTTVPSKGLFQPSSYRIATSAEAVGFLDAVVVALKSNPDAWLRLEVHADERPGALDNTVLADKRAKVLVKELRKRGISKKRIGSDAVGHSGVQPSTATNRIVFDFSDDAVVAVPPTWK